MLLAAHCDCLLTSDSEIFWLITIYAVTSIKHYCYNRFMSQPRTTRVSRYHSVSRYQKKYSPTHLSWSSFNLYHSIFISFFQLLWSIASFFFNLCAWQSYAQPLSMSSLAYLLVWSPPPPPPYTSSPNQCLLFATYVHTITTYFAVIIWCCYKVDHYSYSHEHSQNQFPRKTLVAAQRASNLNCFTA